METIRDCAGNPINYTDPTGHWAQAIHREMTKSAVQKSKIKLTGKQLKYLQDGSVKPDQVWPKKGLWHAHKTRSTQNKFWVNQIKKFRNMKKKRSKNALVHLGTILHSIQDLYAHSYQSAKEDFFSAKKPTKAQRRFHNDYSRTSGSTSANMDIHTDYKDNIYLDWVNNKWTRSSKSSNKRYTKAIAHSKRIINKSFK